MDGAPGGFPAGSAAGIARLPWPALIVMGAGVRGADALYLYSTHSKRFGAVFRPRAASATARRPPKSQPTLDPCAQ